MTQAQIYTHAKWLAAPSKRATPGEAQLLARLADAAIETAREFGVPCTRREALQRARENVAHVRRMAIAKGVEW